MSFGDLVKNIPNALIWAVTACFIAIIAAFVIVSALGVNDTDLRSFINTLLNVAATLFSGTGLAIAGAAAKSASNAEKQTNGALDARIQTAVATELEKRNVGDKPTS